MSWEQREFLSLGIMSLFVSRNVSDFTLSTFPSTPGHHIKLFTDQASILSSLRHFFLIVFLSSAEALFPTMPCNKQVLPSASPKTSGLRFPENSAGLQEQHESGEVDDFILSAAKVLGGFLLWMFWFVIVFIWSCKSL